MNKSFGLRIFVLLGLILLQNGCALKEQSAFFVEANCEECVKVLVEKAEDVSGVSSVKWIANSSFLEVSHRSVSAEQIQEALSLKGFSTQFYLANDSAKALLPACCLAPLTKELEVYTPSSPEK